MITAKELRKKYIEFFESIAIYYLGEDETEENEVYNFSCTEYIAGTIYNLDKI